MRYSDTIRPMIRNLMKISMTWWILSKMAWSVAGSSTAQRIGLFIHLTPSSWVGCQPLVVVVKMTRLAQIVMYLMM